MESNEKSNDFQDVIYTPYYRGNQYLYHECSGCSYHVNMQDDDVFHTLSYYGDTFKFCPNCGRPVIRFAKLPVFLEEINRALFQQIDDIHKHMEKSCEYYLFIELSDDERCELVDKARFARSLQGNGGPIAGPGVDLILKYGTKRLSHWDKKKLKEYFEKKDGDGK